MSDIQPDQETLDRLMAAGKSERVARAKAKAVTQRKVRASEGWNLGPRSAEQSEAARAAWAEKAGSLVAAGVGAAGGAGAEESTGRLSPQERAARVAASLGLEGRGAQAQQLGVPVEEPHTHRMLALIPPSGIQQVQDRQADKVYTWPHLLIVEFVALLAVGAVLLVASFFLDAPLGALANPNLTPNPSKAPWYFLGLQELLRYFHPMVAGVTLPGVGLIVLGGTAYFDKNPSAKPENRKFATLSMTFFLILWTVLVFAGSFFRGPGFNWVWPWVDGLFFEL